jgi:hypothetical protein
VSLEVSKQVSATAAQAGIYPDHRVRVNCFHAMAARGFGELRRMMTDSDKCEWM